MNVPTRKPGKMFEPTTPVEPTSPYAVEYHLHRWSQMGTHLASLRTHEPLAIPAEISGETFADFITELYHCEREYGFVATLTWG